MNQPISRRTVLKGSVAAVAAASTYSMTARSYANILGANDDIRVGVIGFNSRGNSHIDAWLKLKGIRLVSLCDADESVLNRGVARVEKAMSPKSTTKPSTNPSTKPIARAGRKDKAVAEVKGEVAHEVEPTSKPAPKLATYTDFRKMLDNKEIDAISTATPNHWHSLITILACQAGKDVYVEKPVSHNVWEGRQAVEAARKYKRIVQTGTQSRSNMALKEAYAWAQAGNLGKIKVVRGLCYKRRGTIGKTQGDQAVPKTVNYDLWLGPAPMEQPHRKQFHYDWHWQWAYGSGDLGNQGIHQMDTARWALGKNELSPRILSIGGRFGYEDDGQTPNTQIVVHDYGDSMLIFEVRGLPKESGGGLMDKYNGQSIGTVIECEGGYLTDSGYTSSPVAFDHDGKQIKKFSKPGKAEDGEDGGSDHFGNWVKAVHSRKQEALNADILQGHLSSALCHTGNISYRLGQPAKSKEIRDALKENKAAMETYDRFRNHLEDNEVSLVSSHATLGAFLQMDPKTETFVGENAAAANKMLKREYRAPFVVPEQV